MKARFFIADANYQTWKKVFVLTEDGLLHCEYLEFMRPAQINKEVSFEHFKESDYSFGGYQHLREVSKEEAVTTFLTRQSNWVNNYLLTKNSH